MKLIKELNEDLQFIIEESSENGKKSLFIEGVFLQANLILGFIGQARFYQFFSFCCLMDLLCGKRMLRT